MNKIFTLFASSFFCAASLNAQTINETFENYSSGTQLTNNCWSLSGVDLSTTMGISSTKSLFIVPTTSAGSSANSNIGQIITPFINLVAGTSITLKLKLSNDLAGQATRTVQARLLNFSGVYSSVLATITLDKNSTSASAYTLTVPIAAAGVQKLVLDINGNGDGNTWMFLDDMVYASTYNYSAPYACGTYASPITLPIKLLSFSGSVLNNKVQLQWLVDDNHTGDRFEVEKSNDGKNFRVNAMLFTTGEIGNAAYAYNEATVLDGGVYYRIKIINKDNSVSYSKVIFLKKATAGTAAEITLLQNPIQSTLSFSFTSSTTETATVNLYNMAGIKVLSFDITVQKGLNTITEPVDSKVTKGTYILEMRSTTQRRPVKVTK